MFHSLTVYDQNDTVIGWGEGNYPDDATSLEFLIKPLRSFPDVRHLSLSFDGKRLVPVDDYIRALHPSDTLKLTITISIGN